MKTTTCTCNCNCNNCLTKQHFILMLLNPTIWTFTYIWFNISAQYSPFIDTTGNALKTLPITISLPYALITTCLSILCIIFPLYTLIKIAD